MVEVFILLMRRERWRLSSTINTNFYLKNFSFFFMIQEKFFLFSHKSRKELKDSPALAHEKISRSPIERRKHKH
jgi:hypothetical protein